MSMNDESNTTVMSLDYVPGELDRTAPKVIYVQVDTAADNSDRDEPWTGEMDENVSWSAESIGGIEIVYVRGDLSTFLPVPPLEAVDVTKDMVEVAMSAYIRGDDMKGYVGYSENMRMALEAVAPMLAALAHPHPMGDVRDAVRRMASSLADNEWADHVLIGDDDVTALEVEITRLIGELQAMRTPTGEQTDTVVRVEARRCDVCDHIGIDDASTTQGACHNCDWQGDEQKEDLCPGCASHSCMAAACPECGGRYCLVANTEVIVHPRPTGSDFADKAERALSELVDKIVPGLDTGDVIADAVTTSRALTALVSKVERPTDVRAGAVVTEKMVSAANNAHSDYEVAHFKRRRAADEFHKHHKAAMRAALEAALACQPRPTMPDAYRPTDDDVRAWLHRHDIADAYIDQWRSAIDDARSMHLLATPLAPERDT